MGDRGYSEQREVSALFSRNSSHRLSGIEALAIEQPLKPLQNVDLYWDGWAKVVPEEPEEPIDPTPEADDETNHGDKPDSSDSPQAAEGRENPILDAATGDGGEGGYDHNETTTGNAHDESGSKKEDILEIQETTEQSRSDQVHKEREGDGKGTDGAETQENGEDAESPDEEQDEGEGEEGADGAGDGEEETEEEDNSRLLFWVPVEQRDALVIPLRKVVLGSDAGDIDLSSFVHGPDWASCYSPYASL